MRSFAVNRRLNPIKIDGRKCYAVLADTFVCNDLRADEAYNSHQQHGNLRGSDNPIVSGSIGEYNSMLFFEYERMRRLTTGVNLGHVARIALLGADAIAVAYGSEPRLVPRVETNYGDRWGRAVRQVMGAARCDFQNQAVSATTNQSSAEWRVYEERDEFAQ